MKYKIDPLSDARFDFEVGDDVIVLSISGAKLGEATIDSELSPGIWGVKMTTGRYTGKSKGLNGCLLRKIPGREPAAPKLMIRRDQVVPGVVFRSSRTAKLWRLAA